MGKRTIPLRWAAVKDCTTTVTVTQSTQVSITAITCRTVWVRASTSILGVMVHHDGTLLHRSIRLTSSVQLCRVALFVCGLSAVVTRATRHISVSDCVVGLPIVVRGALTAHTSFGRKPTILCHTCGTTVATAWCICRVLWPFAVTSYWYGGASLYRVVWCWHGALVLSRSTRSALLALKWLQLVVVEWTGTVWCSVCVLLVLHHCPLRLPVTLRLVC